MKLIKQCNGCGLESAFSVATYKKDGSSSYRDICNKCSDQRKKAYRETQDFQRKQLEILSMDNETLKTKVKILEEKVSKLEESLKIKEIEFFKLNNEILQKKHKDGADDGILNWAHNN